MTPDAIRPRLRPRTGAPTTTEAAVLALLAIEGERSGYDLLKQVSSAVGYVWAPARSQLYAVLPRLATAGLVSVRTTREGRRPEKQLYRLSESGRSVLETWLASEPDSRETFFLRLFVGGLVPTDVLLGHLAWFRAHVTAELETYQRVDATNSRRGHDRYHHFMLRYALERCERELVWAESVERDLRERA